MTPGNRQTEASDAAECTVLILAEAPYRRFWEMRADFDAVMNRAGLSLFSIREQAIFIGFFELKE
jgi:hypothetical protein